MCSLRARRGAGPRPGRSGGRRSRPRSTRVRRWSRWRSCCARPVAPRRPTPRSSAWRRSGTRCCACCGCPRWTASSRSFPRWSPERIAGSWPGGPPSPSPRSPACPTPRPAHLGRQLPPLPLRPRIVRGRHPARARGGVYSGGQIDDRTGPDVTPRATYLDHAATTPMLPEAVAAMADAHGPHRQRVLAAHRRSPGAARGRGGPRAHRRRRGRPPVRGGAHHRRHRERQPGRQGPLLGAPRGRPAPHPGARLGRSSTTPCSTPRSGSPSTRAPSSTLLDVDADGRVRPETLRAALADDPEQVGAGLGDVGQQRGRHGQPDPRAGRGRPRVRRAAAHRRGAGRRACCRSTSPRPASTRSRSPATSSAARTARARCCWAATSRCTPLLHGGGQERDVRSGTLDVPGGRSASPPPSSWRSADMRRGAAASSPGCATTSSARCSPRSRTPCLNGDPGTGVVDGGPSRLPGNAHLSFPGCEGDSLLMLLDAHGHRVLHRLGLHGRRGAAQPRAAGDGRRRGHRARVAAVLPRPHLDHRRRRRGRGRDRPGRRAGPPGAGSTRRWSRR